MFGSRATIRGDWLSGEKELVRKVCFLERRVWLVLVFRDVDTISSTCCAFAAKKTDGTVVVWGASIYGADTAVPLDLTGVDAIYFLSGFASYRTTKNHTFLKAAPSQVHSRSLCPKPPCSSQARKGPQVGFSLGAQEGSRCSPLGLLNW